MKRIIALLLTMLLMFSAAEAETRWVLCKDYVNVRRKPDADSTEVGRLDAGDDFETDGKIRDGFLRVYGIGEDGEGWIFAGYTSDEQPEKMEERFVCVARKRVACRRWLDGPQIKGKTGWLYNGTNVKVFWKTSEWAVTSRGYINAEWLEGDPE